ncbi:MAG TPA: winged helix-turn-helix domain-containing protein [Pyrinomonadaceae bacterium]|nr:winged helix-turn-helix domain-containing protein [Pyrinomonadaceae bacterium]
MSPAPNAEQPVRFGPFELRVKSGEVRRADGTTVRLPPQPFRVLLALVENAGQVITREELRRLVWGDETVVDFDKGLNFCVRQIREALGDDAQSPRYIETLPRRGYRLIAPVAPAPAEPVRDDPAGRPAAEPPGRPRPRRSGVAAALAALSILSLVSFVLWRQAGRRAAPAGGKVLMAVLPFENLSGDPSQDYFSDGLTEEVISRLGGLRPERLGVIARTTALTYRKTEKDVRQIGRELGVAYVLEGGVRREAGRVRITAQLIQVSDQTHLWAETYERDERDLLRIQSEVAARVARSLELELLPGAGPPTDAARSSDPAAYDAYLKARYLVTKDDVEDLRRSIPYFEQAAARDPGFAPAHAGAALARVGLAAWLDTPAAEVLPRAKAEALRAVELDPSLAEGYAALAAVNFWLEWDWPAAERNARRAVELNPSEPNARLLYASYLLATGRGEAGAAEVGEALALDPVSLLTNGLAAYFFLRARRYDEAIAQARRMLELEPDSPAAHDCLVAAYRRKGMHEEALGVVRARLAREGGPHVGGAAAQALARMDRWHLESLRAKAAAGERVPATRLARAYAGVGDRERALESLEAAVGAREPMLVFLGTHPQWDPVREDPRFGALLRRAGLAP